MKFSIIVPVALVLASTAASFPVDESCKKYHKSSSGENCDEVAKHYGVSVSSLRDWNKDLSKDKDDECHGWQEGKSYCVEGPRRINWWHQKRDNPPTDTSNSPGDTSDPPTSDKPGETPEDPENEFDPTDFEASRNYDPYYPYDPWRPPYGHGNGHYKREDAPVDSPPGEDSDPIEPPKNRPYVRRDDSEASDYGDKHPHEPWRSHFGKHRHDKRTPQPPWYPPPPPSPPWYSPPIYGPPRYEPPRYPFDPRYPYRPFDSEENGGDKAKEAGTVAGDDLKGSSKLAQPPGFGNHRGPYDYPWEPPRRGNDRDRDRDRDRKNNNNNNNNDHNRDRDSNRDNNRGN
ncbi:hypothetical protein J3Q64DRAFT_1845177 [Phycomyces blakesleeanus]|uniref:LysM domain-containing protein n=1 Tax=Phycomyces blakesleeanus TaxID=4837 RepID=A0ABR3BGL4_PHYBL